MLLTDVACRTAKPTASAVRKLSDGRGLQLWVHPNGSKLWRLAYRFARKQPAEILVQQNVDQGIAILRDSALAPQQRADKVRALLKEMVDTKRVALFTLGTYARSASPAELQTFQTAFSGYTTELLLRNVADNPDERISVTGSTARSQDDVIVSAKLFGSMRTNGAPVNLAFRVRKNETGAETVVDVQVEGVWLALSQRDDFSAWLQQHQGDVTGLAHELETRSEKISHDGVTSGPSRPDKDARPSTAVSMR